MNSVRPFQTKLMGVDQISQFRPNFTILEYLEYLEIGQFRIFAMFLFNIVQTAFLITFQNVRKRLSRQMTKNIIKDESSTVGNLLVMGWLSLTCPA